MKLTGTLFRGVAGSLLILGLIVLSWYWVPCATQSIDGPYAVAELRDVVLGGFPQRVLIRGWDNRNPVLLYVHGGPGAGQLPLAPGYSAELEKHFVVVHWDQRGAGASCEDVPWESVTLSQIVQDTVQLAEYLGRGNKIFIIGHSWGSLVAVLAVQKQPDLFYAYVGTGQLVHRDRQEEISYKWVLDRARMAGDLTAVNELRSIHPPYTTQAQFALQRKWLERYHGDVYAFESENRFTLAKYFGREYSLRNRLLYQSCFNQSLGQLLADRMNVDLFKTVPSLEIPVFLFLGREDFNTPSALAVEWAGQLRAPAIETVWFDKAGHFPAVEKPEEFQEQLIRKLLPIARPE